jgi:hypothetical protein
LGRYYAQENEIIDTLLNIIFPILHSSPNISPICENDLIKEDEIIDNHGNPSHYFPNTSPTCDEGALVLKD